MPEETKALKLSIYGALFMAALGIGFFFLTGSEAIKLDGFVSLVGFAIGLITIRVARLVYEPPDEHFHFGYAHLEPFLNALKGLMILSIVGFALASAIGALLGDGRELAAGPAILYAALAMAGCFLIWGIQRRTARRTGSPLLEVETKQWLIDGWISGVVGIAFVVAFLLEGTALAHWVPYVDPALVLILGLVIIAVPVRIILGGVRELLNMAPDRETQARVRERFATATGDYEFAETHVRMLKVGRFLYALIQIVVPRGFRIDGVGDLDRVRQRIADEMADLHPEFVTDIVFTEDRRWLE
jgi:cation diffusion facilitator family transporter